ncbi:hypothetical protein [Pseudonocardia acidicola]|uniref:Uncharacterized protein n=1 Tax=Pseudonocardia acidicola TaxID=2724939 RepID=A0ABX1SL06_9PSEU|nr:hypothetical protein [Pseudonocardia acidicola]NMI02251.1 hypothetical protein [Pseudonocardia acidicola]
MSVDATPTPPAADGDRATPDRWGDIARLPARTVARDHPRRWADTGLPDSLADLDTPLETVWAAARLALDGADQHTLAHTLGLADDAALRIIVATTEQLIATTSEADSEGDRADPGERGASGGAPPP